LRLLTLLILLLALLLLCLVSLLLLLCSVAVLTVLRRNIRPVFRTTAMLLLCNSRLIILLARIRLITLLYRIWLVFLLVGSAVYLCCRALTRLCSRGPVNTHNIIIVICAARYCSQFSSIGVVKTCRPAWPTMRDTECRVLFFISIGVNHPCRARVRHPFDGRPENIYCIVLHPDSPRPA